MPTTTKFIWDEQNYLAETDGADTINVVYTNEPQQYGNLVSTRIGGTTSYHHFDAIGSTRQLTNLAGSKTDSALSDGWGNLLNRTGGSLVAQLWAGQSGYYLDSETGLYAVRARQYEPGNGRWTTIDPTEFAETVNRFIYISNSPMNTNDPSGMAGLQPVTHPNVTGSFRTVDGASTLRIASDACKKEEPKCTFDECDEKDIIKSTSKNKPTNCKKPKRMIEGTNEKKEKVWFCIGCKNPDCSKGCKCNPDVKHDDKTGVDKPVCNCVLPKDAWDAAPAT